MRIKKPINQGKNSANASRPALDFDPTTNDELHRDIWRALTSKIGTENAMNESKLRSAVTPKDDLVYREPSGDDVVGRNESKERRFGKDMRRLVKLVCRAFLNPIYVPWDVEEYHAKHVKGGRDRNRFEFPNPEFGAFSEPLTVVDSKGRIILWYLPGLMQNHQQSDIRRATVSIGPLLKRSVKKDSPNKTCQNWRTNHRNFAMKTARRACEPGAVNFSAGWFAQGHTSEKYPLLPSLNLRTQLYLGSSNWMAISNNVERFLNLTLSLIHPDLFQCGLSMLRKLRQFQTTKDVAVKWQSVYSGIAVISNRATPSHRDSKGRPEWFDTLLNYSNAGDKHRLLIKDLGLNLEYSTGTVVGFCGSILEHEVRRWGNGDRVCYAHFMRESVRKRLDVPPAGWVNRNMYGPS